MDQANHPTNSDKSGLCRPEIDSPTLPTTGNQIFAELADFRAARRVQPGQLWALHLQNILCRLNCVGTGFVAPTPQTERSI